MVDPVAAAPLPRLARKTARLAAAALVALVLAAMMYALAGLVGSTWPRNAEWREPARSITIMVETNGTHTGLVLPIVTEIKDWRATFPETSLIAGGQATHIGVGWGEREVFLTVNTWADLSPLAVLRIATTGGDSVMRVSPYVRPAPSEYHRPLRVSEAQYRRIVRSVEASVVKADRVGKQRSQALVGTDPFSLYYPARGRYTMVNTCNTWTGAVLAAAGVRMGAWTPFAGGVMKWVPPPAGSI